MSAYRAARPKGGDRIAQFLNFAKTQPVLADARNKAFDPRVSRRRFDNV